MSNFPCSTASATQKNLIAIDLDLCRFVVLFAMPTTVELSQCIGVGGWGCLIYSSVSQKIVACLQLRNNAPSLASAADAMRNLKIAHDVKNAPFNLMGFVGSAFHPIKKCLHAPLWAFASDEYDAPEWTFNTMSDAWNRTVASK
jgi:hypothetical protein